MGRFSYARGPLGSPSRAGGGPTCGRVAQWSAAYRPLQRSISWRNLSPKRPEGRAPYAFTLIEVMVAMVAFAIILAAISGVFWGALKLQKRSADSVDAALPTERALSIIRNDLINIVPPGGQFLGMFSATIGLNSQSASTRTLGGASTSTSSSSSSSSSSSAAYTQDLLPINAPVQGQVSPQFYTSSGVVDDSTLWSDVQQVSYALVAPTNRDSTGKDLIRYVTRNLLPVTQAETQQQPLLSGVETLNFYYCDGATWKETWDTTIETNKLPCAIKVQIAMVGDRRSRQAAPLEIIVPLVDAGTNVTQQATQ
jgi:prepilin-type N-terminal cleavage/methylation domain-containing protein